MQYQEWLVQIAQTFKSILSEYLQVFLGFIFETFEIICIKIITILSKLLS